MKSFIFNVLKKLKSKTLFMYKSLSYLILLGYVNLSHAAGTDLLKAGDETVQATMGKDSTLVKWLLGAEVIIGIIVFLNKRTPTVFFGILFVLVFTSVAFGLF